MLTSKICSRCKTQKSLESFAKNRTCLDGRQTTCRDCMTLYYTKSKKKKIDYAVKWNLDNKQKRAIINYKHKLKVNYNISMDEYLQMFDAQNRCCKICKTNIPGRKRNWFAVDHCHKSRRNTRIIVYGL